MTQAAAARIILVTDPAFGDDGIEKCVRLVAGALPPGALCVQLRDKVRHLVSLRLFALRLRSVTRASGASLVINGNARLARDVGADGVHLGEGVGSVAEVRATCGIGVWVSVAAHSDDAVRLALASGADAVLVSPVFPTQPPSPNTPWKRARGVGALRSARTIAGNRMAVYALGGVTAERALGCVQAGAFGIAVVRALLGSAKPDRVARALHDGMAARCYPRQHVELRRVAENHD
jgi:thiamine-phosphate pyrophosphorylase